MAVAEPVPAEAKPRRGWFRRNWWWVLLVVVLGSILLCGGLCAGVFTFRVARLKGSPPYQTALQLVRDDPQVVERLGEPIEDGWVPTGQLNKDNDRGSALLRFQVSGPEGSAEVFSESRLLGGGWGLVRVEVTFEDGQRITLDTSSGQEGAPDDAPLWKP